MTKVRSRRRMTPEELKRRQAEAGRQVSKARGERSRDAIVAAALRLVDEGKAVRQAAVLEIVKMTTNIISGHTVRRHWPAVREALVGKAAVRSWSVSRKVFSVNTSSSHWHYKI